MKKLLFLIALMPTILFAQSGQVKGFEIKGNIAGITDGEAKITTTQDERALVSSGLIKEGNFTVTGSIPEPGLYFLVLPNEQPVYIFLDNSPITITGNKKEIKSLKIEGSASHADFIEFNKIFNPLFGELNAAAAQMQKEMNEKKRDAFLKSYDSLTKRVSDEVGRFVTNRKSSFVSVFLISITGQVSDPLLVEQRFNSLDENVRNSNAGKWLAGNIAYNKVGAVGTDAIDFTQNDVEGKPVTLSSFKGKYVLVDFWASWCKPCRMENPNVVKVYNKFKEKNFTILGVSLDQQKDAWVKAITTDRLAWNHVSDLQSWNNAAAQLYRIQSIPGNLLIDPNGKIIAKDLHGGDLEKKLCEVIGCN